MTPHDAAIKVIQKLRQNGYEALLAGGCVRDMLLERPAKDYDVATSAEPADVVQLFHRTLEVGAQFGVVIVMMNGQQVEVATFRIDGSYVDGRRPDHVKFTTAEEDAARRDFTVNGMFYDPLEKHIIDYVGGQVDLKARVIRTIGSAEDRFSEDYLRMLRAVRFATQLDFTIEPKTLAAIRQGPDRIAKISGERISMELEGLLTCPARADGARLLWETQLAPAIFPGLSEKTQALGEAVLRHLRKAVTFPLGLAALFSGCPVEKALSAVVGLKMSRRELAHLRFLLENRGVLLQADMPRAQLRRLFAEPYFGDLYEWQRAQQKATDQ
ncbi:CCA tRNA nucleotidyltransferase, partial [Planctomycetota bacterium]